MLNHSEYLENLYRVEVIEKLTLDPFEVGSAVILCMKLQPRNSKGDQTQGRRLNTDSPSSFFYANSQTLIGNIQFA